MVGAGAAASSTRVRLAGRSAKDGGPSTAPPRPRPRPRAAPRSLPPRPRPRPRSDGWGGGREPGPYETGSAELEGACDGCERDSSTRWRIFVPVSATVLQQQQRQGAHARTFSEMLATVGKRFLRSLIHFCTSSSVLSVMLVPSIRALPTSAQFPPTRLTLSAHPRARAACSSSVRSSPWRRCCCRSAL